MSLSSIPRPVLFGILGIVAIVAVFLFMKRGGSDDSATSTTATPAADPSTGATSDSGAADDSKSSTAPDTGATAPSDKADKAKTVVEKTSLPKPVREALKDDKIVTVLFWRKQGVEDRAMERVATILQRFVREDKAANKTIAVFDAGVDDLTRWVRITGLQGISQTPSYIVINKKGVADVQTGFVDGETMLNVIVNDWRNYKIGRKQLAKIPTS